MSAVSEKHLELRAKHAAEIARRRSDEQACALDFLVYGDEGDHADNCVHALAGGEPCSRDYDLWPVPEAEPTPSSMYVGTGIGALYGLGYESCSGEYVTADGKARHAVASVDGDVPYAPSRSLVVDLAGWNVGRRA